MYIEKYDSFFKFVILYNSGFCRYLYTDKLDFTNWRETLHLANKYEVKPLIEKIFDEKVSREPPDTFCHLVKNCRNLDGYLEYRCLKYVFDNQKAIFECDSFYHLPHSFVYQVVSSEYLVLDENLIYSALFMWAEKACYERHLEGSGINKRQVLGVILNEIRFPLLPQDFFTDHVSEQGLLDDSDEVKILKHYLHPKKAVGADFKFKTEPRKAPQTAYLYSPFLHETWRSEFGQDSTGSEGKSSVSTASEEIRSDDVDSKEDRTVSTEPTSSTGACLIDGLPMVRKSDEDFSIDYTTMNDLETGLWTLERFSPTDINAGWGYKKETADAIAITSSRDIALVSMQMYGIEAGRKMKGRLVIYKDNIEGWSQDFSFPCSKEKRIYGVFMKPLVKFIANQEYHIVLDVEEGVSGSYGKGGKSQVSLGIKDEEVTFSIRSSKYSTNHTDVSMGQIMGFQFKIYKPVEYKYGLKIIKGN